MSSRHGEEQRDLQKKITDYEAFVNERLRTDLGKVLEARDGIYSDIAEYLQLRNVIEKIREHGGAPQEGLKTLVDLGANFYAHAKIPDASHLFVAVGFGFYVEFTLEEAAQFIEKKVGHLTEKGEKLSHEAAQISARIKIVLEALRELQFSDQPVREPLRTVW